MNETSEKLVNVPAMFYSLFWQTRELGFFKRILEECKVQKLSLMVFFHDYQPGALITLDQELGDFTITPVHSIDEFKYDCAIIGNLRPVIKSFEGNFLLKNFWNMLSRKVKLKGIGNLLKFGKVVLRCAI